ncbi:MAG: cytochrome c3 family protein [Candidatus Promineifilaceae bacterium]
MEHSIKRLSRAFGLFLILGLALTACGQSEPTEVEVTRIIEVPVEVEGPTVEVTRVVEVEKEMEVPIEPAVGIPFEEQWAGSGHANAEAEAFVHWNEDDPQEVPTNCAKCHSTTGYQDYIGADGSAANVVDAAVPVGEVIACEACHNDVTISMDTVLFPSGVELSGLGPQSRCMQCHQGRASTISVNAGLAEAGLDGEADLDTVSEDIGFSNIHYYAAAATRLGHEVMGGYEYEGKAYDPRFDHVASYDTCIGCHNPHTLELKLDECAACHHNVTGEADLVNIRMNGSLVDYDGDGDMQEGIYYEIETLREMLAAAMTAYSTEIAGAPIVYNAEAYPYFFTDTNGDGEGNEGDENYATWTPRLAKAAYNYQVSLKDPGAFAHGGKYIIELLYDSIEDLNQAIDTPVDLSNAQRIDSGHFAATEEPFRHWDEEGAVPGTCSRCHSAAGLPLYIEQGVSIDQPYASGLNCATCHNDLTTFTRYESAEVEFPSGAVLSFGEDALDANLCLNCHQGRASTNTIAQAIADKADDVVDETLRFANIHYFAAGATLFGTEAKGIYEYPDQVYVGRNEHVGAFDSCIECHDGHALTVNIDSCGNCHENVDSEEELMNIRVSELDFDGNGDVTEGIYSEVQHMGDALYAAMQAYADTNEGTAPIVYDPTTYPYFFDDAGEGYATWTPRLLRTAYNYQYYQKDPGAFAHNPKYVIQMLYDSLADIGGAEAVAGMIRPEVPRAEQAN